MGVAQHHDAVSGTAKQHVTDDYALRVSKGLSAVAPGVANMLAAVVEKPTTPGPPPPKRTTSSSSSSSAAAETADKSTAAAVAAATAAAATAAATKMSQCPLLNVSSCPATESLLPGQALALLVYNPLAAARIEHVRLPVSEAAAGGGLLRVIDAATGIPVASALLPAAEPGVPAAAAALEVDNDDGGGGGVEASGDGGSGGGGGAQLAFSVSVPPLSVSTFFIEAHKAPPPPVSSATSARDAAAAAADGGKGGFAETAVVSDDGNAGGGGGHEFVLEAPGRVDDNDDDDDGMTKRRRKTTGAGGGGAAVSVVLDASTGDVIISTRTTPPNPAAASSSSSVVVNATVSVAYYQSHTGDDGFTPSGAYVFRPDASQRPVRLKPAGSPRVVRSSVVSELRQSYGSGGGGEGGGGAWVSLTTRLWAGESHAEVEWTVGPIPVDGADGIGKEVILRYTTGLETKGQWATDANGRDMQRRRRDSRDDWTLTVTEPVAGNYVPAGSVASLIGDETASFHLLPDRSQGVASIADGELEAMVHRRVLKDDNLGVGEFLNETQCGCTACACAGLTARGTHLLAATAPVLGPRTYRALQQRAQTPLVMAFAPVGCVDTGPTAWAAAHRTDAVSLLGTAGGAAAAADGAAADVGAAAAGANGGAGSISTGGGGGGLPLNVHLLSFEPVRSAECAGCVLVRLAHLFEAPGQLGWDPELSSPAKVDLARLFPNRAIVSVQELLLSGVPPRTTGGGGGGEGKYPYTSGFNTSGGRGGGGRGGDGGGGGEDVELRAPVDTMVTLGPMEVRAVRVMLE